jgi:tetratricopeptide (TPR) repeat protein
VVTSQATNHSINCLAACHRLVHTASGLWLVVVSTVCPSPHLTANDQGSPIMNFNMNEADPLAGAQHSDVLSAKPETDEARVTLVAEIKRRGNAAFKAGLLREASTLYTCAVGHDPASVALWGNRSMTHAGMGMFQEALDDALKAIEVDATWAKGYFRKGMALNGLKRYREACQAFQKSLELEPSSKVSKREAEKASKLASESEAAAAAAAAAAKPKPTPVSSEKPSTTSSPTRKAAAAATDSSAPSADKASATKPKPVVKKKPADDVEEELGDEVRGYRVLADGRKTTFFNMERTEEEKALIGDIRPKRIDPSAAPEVLAPAPIAAEGASVWNQGGTFEERDMNEWAKNNITERVKGVCAEGDGFKLEVEKVEKIDGDASITFARGRKRHVFDFELLVKWEATLEGDDKNKVSGKLFYMDFNGDTAADEELDVELRWEQREKAGKFQAPLKECLMSMRAGSLRSKLNETLLGFIAEFRAVQ